MTTPADRRPAPVSDDSETLFDDYPDFALIEAARRLAARILTTPPRSEARAAARIWFGHACAEMRRRAIDPAHAIDAASRADRTPGSVLVPASMLRARRSKA